MVGPERPFESVNCCAPRSEDPTGVVDQNGEVGMGALETLGEGPHRPEIREIEMHHLDHAACLCIDIGSCLVALGCVPSRDHDPCALRSESCSRGLSKPAVSTGDEHGAILDVPCHEPKRTQEGVVRSQRLSSRS